MLTQETRFLEWLNAGRPSDRMLDPGEVMTGSNPQMGNILGSLFGGPDTSAGLADAAMGLASPLAPDPTTHGILPLPKPAPSGMPPTAAGAAPAQDPYERALRALMLGQMGRQAFGPPLPLI